MTISVRVSVADTARDALSFSFNQDTRSLDVTVSPRVDVAVLSALHPQVVEMVLEALGLKTRPDRESFCRAEPRAQARPERPDLTGYTIGLTGDAQADALRAERLRMGRDPDTGVPIFTDYVART